MTISNTQIGMQLLQERYPTKKSQRELHDLFRKELYTILEFNQQLNRRTINYNFITHSITEENPIPLNEENVKLYLRDFILFRISEITKKIFPENAKHQGSTFDYFIHRITGKTFKDTQDFIDNGPDPREIIPQFNVTLDVVKQKHHTPKPVEVAESTIKPIRQKEDSDAPPTSPISWYQCAIDAIVNFFKSLVINAKKTLLQLKN